MGHFKELLFLSKIEISYDEDNSKKFEMGYSENSFELSLFAKRHYIIEVVRSNHRACGVEDISILTKNNRNGVFIYCKLKYELFLKFKKHQNISFGIIEKSFQLV